MNAPIRDRHEWFTPLSRPGGISPDSPCPDACQDREIRPRYFCVACLAFHPQDEHWIDRSNPPPPENAEDRTLRHIREWEEILGDGEGIDPRTAMEIRQRIKCLKAELDESSGNPTRCSPDLPGGIGTLKTKPTWELSGLAHTVTAWTKAEAKALFREHLRSQGERGRFSVPISNPKRVKSASEILRAMRRRGELDA